MSDIIYTPPASSGGGQNPTTNYIPLNNGTSNFVDSNIFNDVNSMLYTFNFINGREGLRLDFLHKEYSLGDFDYNNQGTTLVIDDTNQSIATYHNNQQKGLGLGFINQFYWLGDYNDTLSGAFLLVDNTNRAITLTAGDLFNNTTLYIDDANSVLRTLYQGNNLGLYLDFSVKTFTIGDIDNNFHGTRFYVDDDNQTIQTTNGVGQQGIKLDFINSHYYFGDYNGLYTNANYIYVNSNGRSILLSSNNNTSSFLIDGNTDKFTFTTNNLNFVGAALLSNTSGGSSGKHLVLTIQGTQYKIALNNI